MGKISELMAQRCPKCAGKEVRRSPRRGFFELVVLSSIAMRPFRCQACRNRFYAFKLRNGDSAGAHRRWPVEADGILSVIVYGHGPDKQPFQETTSVRLLSSHSAELRLLAKVGPGQELVLLDPASEEEHRCRVESVTESAGGESMVCVEFHDSVWEFWVNATHPAANSNP
jgi:hypothetical protein